MKKNTHRHCFGFTITFWVAVALTGLLTLGPPPARAVAFAATPAKPEPIPMDQIGAVAGKQYQGDGLSIAPTPDGARLQCVFQKLEGQATREGLWLTSTADRSKGERFRVVATAVGRGGTEVEPARRAGRGGENLEPAAVSARPPYLEKRGTVQLSDDLIRFVRPGLTEEYSVSVDGVRQDFIVAAPPRGTGQLRVELEVTGAAVEPLADGARLVLDGSGRKIAYNRLRATDATGKKLTAHIQVINHSTLRTPHSAIAMAVVVDDAAAIYPVRIDPTFSDANWISMATLAGADSWVYAAAVDDAGNLYIGGDFAIVGDVVANHIARWNGSVWSALGTGTDGGINALAVSGSDVYAGGWFEHAGGIEAIRIAKWDGNAWSALGSGVDWGTGPVGDAVYALAVSGTNLYVGGDFTRAGGNTANYIAKWDGSAWSALGSGMGSAVRALAVSGSDLYAGGDFDTAGGASARGVAKWNGSAWSALGLGMSDYSSVCALALSGSDLYVGGYFTHATNAGPSTVQVNHIAKWNGSAWSALGSGMDSAVLALAVSGSAVYAGGSFTNASGTAASHIAKWDGSVWSALGAGTEGGDVLGNALHALTVWGTNLFVGGDFITAGTTVASCVAKWDGRAWSSLGSGMAHNPGVYYGPHVSTLAVSGTDLYVGGSFTMSSTGNGGPGYNIVKWNGSGWSALGSGLNDNVVALGISGTNLYVGGNFTTAGGNPANHVARWDGSVWSALGAGMDSVVLELAVSGSDVYAGGGFTRAGGIEANSIAKWDGSVWSALGSGMAGGDQYGPTVFALAVSGTNLYAGGNFTAAGGNSAYYIARWNGSVWSALGSGMGGGVDTPRVYALAVSGTSLYAGGSFTTAGGNLVNNIAKWDGSAWSALGSGMNNSVYALAVSGTNLYAGGWFIYATNVGPSGIEANYIAKWDGQAWSALGSGMNNSVNALAVSGPYLYAGGGFTTAGGKVSACVASAIFTAGGRLSNLAYSPGTGFRFTFSDATVGQPYRIQGCWSLASNQWVDLIGFTYPGPVMITDYSALGAPSKFYRAVWAP